MLGRTTQLITTRAFFYQLVALQLLNLSHLASGVPSQQQGRSSPRQEIVDIEIC